MSPTPRSTPDPAPDGIHRRLPHDRGFLPAIEAGFLTVEQAAARGNRRAMAERLSAAHDMSLELAFDVADNRLTLTAALTDGAAAQTAEPNVRTTVARPELTTHPSTWRRGIRLVVFAVLVVPALGFTWAAGTGWSHYRQAADAVREFETGKPPAAINYGDGVYERALRSLDRVPRFTPHHGRAAALRRQIEHDVASFQRGRRSRQKQMGENLARRIDRDRTLIEAQAVNVPTPEADEAECESLAAGSEQRSH